MYICISVYIYVYACTYICTYIYIYKHVSASGLQGDLLPRGGLEPEHAAHVPHLERHGHDEQLPLPDQGSPSVLSMLICQCLKNYLKII